MKKLVLIAALGLSANVSASEPVISGYGLDDYHGYVGIGYDHPFIGFKGYHPVEADGLMVTFGHNYESWLDLELRASTATGYKTTPSKTVGAAAMSVKQNYNLTGLLKFKWQPVRLLEFSLSTGMNYMALETAVAGGTTQNTYKSGLVLGAGVGVNVTKHYSINADFQSCQRDKFLGSDQNTWSAGNLSIQYHF